MRLNSRMRRLVPEAPSHVRMVRPELSEVADHEFTRSGDCIVFSGQPHLSRNDFPDRSGYECFANHIHIEDFVSESSPENLVDQSFALATSLNQRLREFAPDASFRFIIAASGGGCTLRFHVVRAGEQWEKEDLESYGEEAIAVIESDELRSASTGAWNPPES